MTLRDEDRLVHMWEAATKAVKFVEGRSRSDLDSDDMFAYSVRHAVVLIGEAASRLSEPARNSLPGLNWKGMIGMRNRVVHGYYDLDDDIVWNVVVNELPRLVSELSPIVGAMKKE